MAVRDEWYRSPEWSAEAQELFEQKLRKARNRGKGQYVRIKAFSLANTGDPTLRAAARELFLRLIREFHDSMSEVVGAHEALGQLYEQDGLFIEAEQHYRKCLTLIRTARSSYSGTSGICEILLADLIMRSGQADKYNEAEALLAEFDQNRPAWARLTFNSDRYRHAVATARVKAHLGKWVEAAAYAQTALQLARVTEPQFPRHPTVGIVQADAATIEEMSILLATTASDHIG